MKGVYTDSKIFNFPDKLRAMREGRWTAPIHVRLKPTNHCNHRCWYCCYRNKNLYLGQQMSEADQMPPAKMQEIVSDIVEMGVKAVTFSGGGDPLCHNGTLDAVNRLTDGGVKVAMLTNGGLLQGQAAQALARRATWVRLSVDAADGKTYAANRRVAEGEFDRVCRNIHDFSHIPGRTCVLGVNYIITQENSHTVLDFLRLAKQLGVDNVKVCAAVVSTNPEDNDKYLRPFFEPVKREIAAAIAELADESFTIIDRFHMPNSGVSYRRKYSQCPFVQCLTVIAADFNVYSCQDKAYTDSGRLGSTKDRSFKDLWFSEELRSMVRKLNPSLHCRHHCVAQGKNLALLEYLQAAPEHLEFV